MPLPVSCICGKQFKVADEYSGRKIKCPSCGGILAVTTAPTMRPTATPGLSSPPGMVRFACSCGKQMQAKAEYAGKSVRCPDCQTPVPIPGGDEGAAAVQVVPVSHRAPPPPMDIDDDEAPRPRRRAEPRRSGSAMPIILIAAVLLLLIGGGVVAMLFFMGGGGAEQAYIPGDSVGFVSLRVADVWNNKATQDSLKALPNGMTGDGVATLMEMFVGLKPTDIERVTFVMVMDNPQKPLGWGIVTLSKSVDEKTLLTKIEGLFKNPLKPTSFQEKTHNGKKYNVLVMAPGSEFAIHFAKSTLVIVSNEEGMKRCLDQKGGKASGVLERGLAEMKGKHQMVAAFAVTDDMTKAMSKGAPPEVAPLLEAKGVLYYSDVADKSLTVLTLVFDADDKAAKAKEAMVGFKALAIQMVPALKQQPGLDPMAAKALAQAESALRDLSIEQSGKDVTVKVQMDNAAMAIIPGLLLPAIQKVREAAANTASSNNLKQLSIAMISYADAHGGQLPPFIKRSAAGKPLWSWRVELLPYLEEGAMYNQLKQDEPWNGPNNSRVLAKMPKVFRLPSAPENSTSTHYQVFQGQGAVFNAQLPATPIRYPVGITDGTSNTIMIVESRFPTPWAAGNVFDVGVFFNPQGPHTFPAGGLGTAMNQPITAAMFDGSVLRIKPTVNPQHLAWAIMPNDGNVLPGDWAGK